MNHNSAFCQLETFIQSSFRFVSVRVIFPSWLSLAWRRSRWMLLAALAMLLPAHARLLHRGAHHPLLVGYFGQWSLANDPPFYLKQMVSNGDAALLDQLNYSQASVKGGRCSIADPEADLNTIYGSQNSVSGKPDSPTSPFRGYFHQLKELEGAASGFADDARAENRNAFVSSCVDTFLRGHFAPGIDEPGIFDGIDVDWEYPKEGDADNFHRLLEEFRRQMNSVRPGLRLSIAVGPSPRMLPDTDFTTIAQLVDQIGVMNYDYNGPWSKTTGFLAPLFGDAKHRSGNIEASMAAYETAGAPREKLLMGVPFYGYGWTGVSAIGHGLFQTGHGISGDRPYRYIRTLTTPASLYRDPNTRSPWLFDGVNFWTYDDAVSVSYKVSYAAQQHLGGIMIWELSEDTADGELLKAAHGSLWHPLEVKDFPAAPLESTP
jgi:chitinase